MTSFKLLPITQKSIFLKFPTWFISYTHVDCIDFSSSFKIAPVIELAADCFKFNMPRKNCYNVAIL